MRHAAITGWGKCLPPAVLTNQDLSTFVDTDDEWIVSRTGMKERRVSHVPVSDLAHVACARALAAAGKQAEDVGMIFFGSCSFDDMVPNAASRVQKLLGASNAACLDVNTACTSGMYGLSVANSMIRSGVIDSALVIGAEVISWVMDWPDRNVSVLFGDGAAAFYLEASEQKTGVVAEALGCDGDSREILTVNGLPANEPEQYRDLFDTLEPAERLDYTVLRDGSEMTVSGPWLLPSLSTPDWKSISMPEAPNQSAGLGRKPKAMTTTSAGST